jgi:ABC-2 type transport system permease protein
MEQLRVTPLRRTELMIGKSVPVLAIASVDFVIMFLIATQFYRIPMRGSWQLLFGLTGMYITVEMGVGLIISSMARSQQQSLLLVFLIGVLNVAFSGYLVPVKNMPWVLNRASQLFPVQHYMSILRHVMLKGATLGDIAGDVVALAALGIVIGSAAYAVVSRRLD